ncbi:sensor domain-containing diguanylate cyclase [Bacillus sp. FJAT-29790]|uniref:sensor domain-containing diguanylate cyclase n=1 Tax=Bacillus sp. FJAT-29790 TaxID=1895002 RepID=UPI001C21F9E0|nr:sensor domain-containing diguanylate cyclase [Bacillus sp. FJAT-29790]MBU8879578.1 sensor domain-containing diguanylate cyclase [Bacillus sp. FJAT-29790]
MVSPKIKTIIWLAWIVIVPLGIWMTYKLFPPEISGQEWDILAFLVLMSFGASMPMVISNIPIFLLQWVSLAVFLTFGLFVEMVLAQVAIIVLLIGKRIRINQLFRFPINSLMFFIVSLLSGTVYYMIGGKSTADFLETSSNYWLAAVYPIVYYVLNQLFLSFFRFLVYNQKEDFFGKNFIWETVTSLITFPIGFILYILYKDVGLLSILFVGVPFASLSIILNLYYSSVKINDYLQKAMEIGHELAERLNVDEIIDLLMEKLMTMLPVDYAYLLDVCDDHELRVIRSFEKDGVKSAEINPLRKNEGISGVVWATEKSALFNTKKEWKDYAKGYMPESAESVLCVPIVRHNKVVAVLFLASTQKRAYKKSQLMIVDILCSHFAISVENARYYEETKEKSERCALTKLFNYRYFENLLNEEFEKLQNNQRQQLSLIILDLDHFKAVNDTYGHQSGNEVLCDLACRLTALIGDKGTVARYGGEEFVILLSDVAKAEAFDIAEHVRQTIANNQFTLTQHMESDCEALLINITVSIGIATAPYDADDSLTLIRYADRALYVGAKRAGRNRVAEYVK